jgi:hypothetical protein
VIQVREVAIWNHDGARRTVSFRLGELNIITGEAKTGKSALLEIVEFCSGRRTVSLPEGVLTRVVDWYGVIFAAGAQAIFVGRPAPQQGQGSVSGAHLAIGGTSLVFPEYGELEVNSNADAVTEYLTRAAGIGEFETAPPPSSTRPALRPNVRHASIYCFQRQNEIANPRQLFHRQEEDFMPQAIKDTLPYFLGAVDREVPTLRNRLHFLRRDLRQAERRLEDAQRFELRVPGRSSALLSEAIDAGLVAASDSEYDPLQLLRAALETPTEPELGQQPEETEYRRLAAESQQLTGELRGLGDRINALRTASTDQDEYRGELVEQAARLETLGLFGTSDGDGSVCPICNSHLERPDATVSQLIAATGEVQAEVSAATAAAPARRTALDELETRAAEMRERLRETHVALAALSRDQERVRAFRDVAIARGYVKGRIVQHLEELDRVEETSLSGQEQEVARLRREVAELEERLDPEIEREQMISRLNVIGEDMTTWADQLGLEHAAGRARIDGAQLTVVVDTNDGPIPLERMGSASNWVGYHLVAHLGLHRWFTTHKRPVPRFLMLDQPTQAFYPPDVNALLATDVDTDALSDDDRTSVAEMFELMRSVVDELAPDLQIIVMDHANLATPWFQDSVVEVWRDGNKLVPLDWLGDD